MDIISFSIRFNKITHSNNASDRLKSHQGNQADSFALSNLTTKSEINQQTITN